MNLLSNRERWLSKTPSELVDGRRQYQYFPLALKTVDAVTPSLSKVGEGYLSEMGDIEVFLYVVLDNQNKRVLVSIVKPSESEEKGFTPLHTVYDEAAKDLVAAFLCDFPDALFSIEGGKPLVMFLQELKLKRFITLNNMIEAAQNKCKKICVAVPGDKNAPNTRGARTAEEIMGKLDDTMK